MRLGVLLVLGVSSVLSGCAHHQLRHNAVAQAHTVEDVHTQQVLDNLAKFAANPNAMPHFSWPNSSSAAVDDTINGGAGFNFSPHRLTGWMFNLGGTRRANEAYTLTPINDPRKLELMRCAYQRAVSPCCCRGESANCPNCEKRFNKFYLGSETVSKTPKTINGRAVLIGTAVSPLPDDRNLAYVYDNVSLIRSRNDKNENQYRLLADAPGKLVQAAYKPFKVKDVETGNEYELHAYDVLYRINERVTESPQYRLVMRGDAPTPDPGTAYETKVVELLAGVPSNPTVKPEYVDGTVEHLTEQTGKVTSACLHSCCWFEVSNKPDCTSCSHCSLTGRHCGTYVHVPECGRAQLTRLTLAILDIALNDPPAKRTKQVVAYLDKNNRPTTKDTAVYKVTANIPFSSSASQLHPRPTPEALIRAELELRELDHDLVKLLQRKDLAEFGTPNLKAAIESAPHERSYNLLELFDDEEAMESLSSNIPEAYRKLIEYQQAALDLKATQRSLEEPREAGQLDYLEPTPTPVPNAGFLEFQIRQDALAPR